MPGGHAAMNRRLFAVALAAALALPLAPALAQAKTHKVAIHLDESDPQRMNLALNNVENIQKYYAAKGEAVTVEIVTYGPGLVMLRADSSPVKDRVAAMSLEYPTLAFSACENTRAGMSKREGKEVPLLKEAKSVPSGVIRLIELQEQGWSYLRP